MRNKLLIIEDDVYRYFATKQILESQLRLSVTVVGVDCQAGLLEEAKGYKPSAILFHPKGGVVELIKTMKRRHVNRINTEIMLVVTNEVCGEQCSEWLHQLKRESEKGSAA